MRWIGIALLVFTTAAQADKLSEAISLLKFSDPSRKVQGARMVGSMGPSGKKAAPALIANLGHDSWGVRKEMKVALKDIGVGVIPSLIKGMKKSKSALQRAEIAEMFSEVGTGTPRQAAAIAQLMKDPDLATRRKIAEALAVAKPSALPVLMKCLGSRSKEQRDAASWGISRIGLPAIDSLEPALKNKNPLVRAAAANALARIGEVASQSASKLLPLMKDSDAAVRLAATYALGQLRSRPGESVPLLIAVLNDPDARIRKEAVVSLSKYNVDAAAQLVSALAGPQQEGAKKALLLMGKDAGPALGDGLASEDAAVREGSLRTLGRMGVFVYVESSTLSKRLEDKDVSVRRAAAEMLTSRHAKNSIPELIAAVGDADPDVRVGALRALGHAGRDDRILPILNSALTDKDAALQVTAAGSLWQQGQPSDVVKIARGLLAGTDARARDAAAIALRPMARAAEAALPELIAAGGVAATPALVDALGAITAAHGNGLLDRAQRFKRAKAGTRKSIDAALDWLKRFQDTIKSKKNKGDGRWHPTDFGVHDPHDRVTGAGQPLYAAGVTGMAVSAFLAVGREQDPDVHEALGFLLRAQTEGGFYNKRKSQHFLIDHAYATIAMCEAWILTNDPRYRRSARRAVDACVASRNPFWAWRYEPRGGENDTHVTVTMLTALAMAERGGLDVDPDAFTGGGRLIRYMTDGRIGYNVPGAYCARPEGLNEVFPCEESGAMSAAGMWGLGLVERHGVERPDLKVAIKTCVDLLPLWNGGRLDMYYWYYGTLAFYAQQAKEWKKWYPALEKTLIENQRKDSDVFAGSWNPAGPWGHDGGRVYSTALCALALSTPCRLSPDFAKGKPVGAYAKAAKALAALAKHENKPIAARAKLWALRAGRK